MVMTRPPRVRVGGRELDPCRILNPLSITHGTSDLKNQPDPPSCTWQYMGEVLAEPLVQYGLPVEVDVEDPASGAWLPRFRGRVTDVVSTRTGGDLLSQVTCAGTLADLANQRIGDTPWPSESLQARWNRVTALLPQWTWVPLAVQGTSVSADVVPTDIDSRSALDVLRDLTGSYRLVVYQRPDGAIGTINPRRPFNTLADALAGLVELDACSVIDERQWSISGDNIVNVVTVSAYFITGQKQEQVEATQRDTASIARYGHRNTQVSTVLADDGAGNVARALADAILKDWALPRWIMPQVEVIGEDFQDRDPGQWTRLMNLQAYGAVSVPHTLGMPLPSQGRGKFVVCGWKEDYSYTGGRQQQRIILSLARDTLTTTWGHHVIVVDPVQQTGWPPPVSWALRVRLLNGDTLDPVPGIALRADIGGLTSPVSPQTDANGYALVPVQYPFVPGVPVTVTIRESGFATDSDVQTDYEVHVACSGGWHDAWHDNWEVCA